MEPIHIELIYCLHKLKKWIWFDSVPFDIKILFFNARFWCKIYTAHPVWYTLYTLYNTICTPCTIHTAHLYNTHSTPCTIHTSQLVQLSIAGRLPEGCLNWIPNQILRVWYIDTDPPSLSRTGLRARAPLGQGWTSWQVASMQYSVCLKQCEGWS